MCDYSLHGVATRPAKVGDRLITKDFCNTMTRGFAAVGEPDVAVCLMPGTELAFEANERRRVWLQMLFFRKDEWKIPHKVGRFCQINMNCSGVPYSMPITPKGGPYCIR